MRKRISLLAACGLVAVGLATTPAHAADPVFPLLGPAALPLPVPPATGSPKEESLVFTLGVPSAGGGFGGEAVLTVDLTKVAGIATVRENTGGAKEKCTAGATTLVCTVRGTLPRVELLVAAAKNAKNGDTGEITVTGKTAGATITPAATRLSVGGPDLVMREMALKGDPRPGESQPLPLVFTNAGTQAARGVVLELETTRGMSLVETYDNCRTRTVANITTALCSVDGDFEPGETYELAGNSPLHVKANPNAYSDRLGYGIHPAGDEPKAAQWDGKAPTGKRLGVTKRAAKAAASARAVDLNPGDNRRTFDFHTRNTADFTTAAVTLEGDSGDTLTTAFAFENKGPAWIRSARAGDSAARTVIVLPDGVRVVRKPDGCTATTATGGERADQLGAPRYVCALGDTVRENQRVVYPFDLKVEKTLVNAKGSVTVGDWGTTAPRPHSFDPNPANNTAVLVVNAEDGATGPRPTPRPSTSAGTPSPGASATPTATASATAAAAKGTGTGTGSGTGTTAHGSGNLASTGVTAGPIALGAAALIAAGGALYVAVRRRGPART
ncbi:peptidase [Streptomyces sp. NPDC059999]|uniref:peptidase n=1 Tax=Streptomyces sp. NPDC059999 TaxID=3347030 RepID=UPI0036A30ACF